MEQDPQRWIAALRAQQNYFRSIVEPLSPDQVLGPSYHSWTIAQVLGHLGGQAEIFSVWLEASVARSGDPGRDFMPPIWDAWNARSPEQQAADAVEYNERFAQRYER